MEITGYLKLFIFYETLPAIAYFVTTNIKLRNYPLKEIIYPKLKWNCLVINPIWKEGIT